MDLKKEHRFHIFSGVLAGMLVTLVALGLLHLSFQVSGRNEFCGRCHEMQQWLDDYSFSSHAVNHATVVANCTDCHLPAEGLHHYTYKAYAGIRDVVMHILLDPEEIDWEEKLNHKDRFLFEDACTSCHSNLTPPGISRGAFLAHRDWERGRTTKRCWDCHETMVHHNKKTVFTPFE